MNLVLKSPNVPPCEAGKDISAVVLCEDATSMTACEVLQLLRQNLKEAEGRLLYNFWNIEALAFPTYREMAAAEAADGDMIIVSIHEAPELPEVFRLWMKRCLDLRKNRPGALVAVLDSDLKKPVADAGMFSELKEAATVASMDFFATRKAKEDGTLGGTEMRASQTSRPPAKARKPMRKRIAGRKRGGGAGGKNKKKQPSQVKL